MTRSEYYTALRELARQVRTTYGLTTPKVTLTDMRRIYRAYGIRIDMNAPKVRGMRGAYFKDESGPWVALDRTLPTEQRIYTLAHELKHHLTDEINRQSSPLTEDVVEIGAEVFAAELIYPEQDFRRDLAQQGVTKGACTAEHVVRLKRASQTTLSFTALGKLAEFTGYAQPGSLKNTHWKKLDERLFGEPLYKQILRRRASHSGRK